MDSQKGLTALELLIVVAIIAMLAAVAVPRFSLLDREAREQAVVSLADGVRSSAEITHRVWSAAGRPDTLTFQGEELRFVHGYPVEQAIAHAVIGPGGFRQNNGVWMHEDARSALDCGVVYLPPATEGVPATVNAYTAGC
ncbi:MAG TPA: type II secretion system protein [Woeseiaceae bacterium]|nr:type II secretion system protein [Woeseiaceae bacterium]